MTAAGNVDMSIIAYNEEHGVKGIERSEVEVRGLYEKWLMTHGKQYNALGEKDRRFEIFKDNLRFVDEHNAAADKGEHSFRLGMNKFADLTNEEYRSMYLGVKPGENRPKRVGVRSDRYKVNAGESLPDSVDWREKGAVAPVKDQGGCGKFSDFSVLGFIRRWLSLFGPSLALDVILLLGP